MDVVQNASIYGSRTLIQWFYLSLLLWWLVGETPVQHIESNHPDDLAPAIEVRQLHPTRFQDLRWIQFLSADVTATEPPVEQLTKRPQILTRAQQPAENQAQDFGQPTGELSPIPEEDSDAASSVYFEHDDADLKVYLSELSEHCSKYGLWDDLSQELADTDCPSDSDSGETVRRTSEDEWDSTFDQEEASLSSCNCEDIEYINSYHMVAANQLAQIPWDT